MPTDVQRWPLSSLLRYRCHLLELVVKNLHSPMLESAIIKIINGNALSSAKKSIVKSIRAVYVWKQSGYGITYSGSSYYVSFGIWSSLTEGTCQDCELNGPDKVRKRSSGMIGMALVFFSNSMLRMVPGLDDRFHVPFAECLRWSLTS